MRILGIGYFVAHDANAAVVSEEGVEFACSEERFSRKKRDGAFPQLSLDHIYSSWGRADVVVAAYNNARQYNQAHEGISDRTRHARFRELQRVHERTLRASGVTEFLGHHFSHAAGAFYTSGFSDAIVVTYDGGIVCEPWLATVWQGKEGELKPLRQITRLEGATAAIRYSAVTSLLGFRPVHDEGKVTGLAARGLPNPDCIRELGQAFDSFTDPLTYYDGHFAQRFASLREKFSAPDIAASVQFMTEEAIVNLLNECVPDPSKTNCVMAGGLFANVLMNLRVKRMGFQKIYVYPAMGDEGLAVGAALAYAVTHGIPPQVIDHVYLGPQYPSSAIADCLVRAGLPYTHLEDVESIVANHLANGKVVARFDGRMEFGPRALGNRSILYRADDVSVNRWLNQKLGRTETMPFAPITLLEFSEQMYSELSGLEKCTLFMTTVVPCTKQMCNLSPAVVHVDGTARPQIVSPKSNRSLHQILTEYHALTGLPSLINTSFNMHGEPIVCSPDDAVRCFLQAELDYLAIGNYIVSHPNRN